MNEREAHAILDAKRRESEDVKRMAERSPRGPKPSLAVGGGSTRPTSPEAPARTARKIRREGRNPPAVRPGSRESATGTVPTGSERNPAAVYLASMTTGSGRASTLSTIRTLAGMLGEADWRTMRWEKLNLDIVQTFREALAEGYAPATTNRYLTALRQIARAAWRLGMMDAETCFRIADIPNIRRSRPPVGRVLDDGELTALFAACNGNTASGARDACALALLLGCGLRRSEAVAVRLKDIDPETWAIRIRSRGKRKRIVHVQNGTRDAINAWRTWRGDAPGPLLLPVSRNGVIGSVGMTAQALMKRLTVRSGQARIDPCSPRDLRRTFVSAALDSGTDIAVVQKMAGHASPATTARYDRRPELVKRAAAGMIRIPFNAETPEG